MRFRRKDFKQGKGFASAPVLHIFQSAGSVAPAVPHPFVTTIDWTREQHYRSFSILSSESNPYLKHQAKYRVEPICQGLTHPEGRHPARTHTTVHTMGRAQIKEPMGQL